MYNPVSHTRAALVGLFFAMIGFSFALATNPDGGQGVNGADAASRLVGSSTLRFTNPVIGTDRDLGDVALGSSLVRYARATGGVRPYTFTSTVTTSPGTLKDAIAGSTSTLSLFSSGMLSGSMGNIPITKSPLRFNITVADAKGSNASSKTEPFRITIDDSGVFKFAIDSLCEGIQYQPYTDILQVLRGNAPFTFTATGVKLNGTAVADLEAIGLSISVEDGTVFGKPIAAGVVTFTANCKDVKGNSAASRSGAAVGQLITLVVTPNSIIASDVIATSISIKTGVAGKDSIKYSGIAELKGTKLSALSGKKLVLKIGGYTTPDSKATPATLDDKGKTTKIDKADKSKTAPTVKASVSAKSVKVSVGKETFGTKFGTISGATKILAVQLQIGDILVGAEVLLFTVKSGSKGSTLTYKFGAAGALGGTFLVTTVTGKDDTKSAAEDDAWKVAFIATPPSTTTGTAVTAGSLTGVNKVVVNIGSAFTDSLAASESKGKIKTTDKRSSKDAKVVKVAADGSKGKGSMQTGMLPYTQTGIHEGSKSTQSTSTFPLNIDLQKGTASAFFGEGAATIYKGSKSGWSTKVPK
jgi:hypothetical protein